MGILFIITGAAGFALGGIAGAVLAVVFLLTIFMVSNN